jgi:undecaprenyl-diphosphatase
MVPMARGEIGTDMSEITSAGRRRLLVSLIAAIVLVGAAFAAVTYPIEHRPPLDGTILLAINAAAAKIPGIATCVTIMDANFAELVLATSIVVLWFCAQGAQAQVMRRRALLTVLAFFPTYGVARVLQGLDHRPRPIVAGVDLQPLTDPAAWHQMRLNFTDWGSFPSDHSALVAIVLVAALSINRRAGLAVMLLGLVVALYRVAVGYHWPSDVLGGTLLGLIVATVLFALEGRLKHMLDGMLEKIETHGALTYALAFVLLSDIAHGFSTIRLLAHGAFHTHLFH